MSDNAVASPQAALERMGISSIRIRRFGHDSTNTHWRISTLDGPIFLRRSVSERTIDEVSFEVRVQRGLAARGWPVPRAITEPFVLNGAVWCAFEALPGRIRRPRSADGERSEQRARGRLLARLHADLRELDNLGQKPGWQRAERSFDLLDGYLDRVALTHPREADELRRYAAIAREQLTGLGLDRQPAQLIHGDFQPCNLLYRGDELSGLLDLDLCHLNHRLADFAIGGRGLHGDVIAGYEDETPLEPIEWELLIPVYRAWYLMTAQTRLAPEYGRNPQFGYLLGYLSREPAVPARRRDR